MTPATPRAPEFDVVAKPRAEPNRYERVRRELQDRGYLQGGIQRFLLRDVLSPGRVLAGVPRAAIKAALLGGPLLGALLAGSAAATNRPLVSAADLPLLWLYFSAICGAGLFVLDAAAGWLAVALARRRGARTGDASRAALLVALPTLAYLLTLWFERGSGSGGVGDLVFLACAVLVTLGVAWLARLVSLTGIVGRTGQVPDRSRRAVLVLGGACLLIVGVLAGVRAVGTGRASAPVTFDVAPDAVPLLMIGVDGLDSALIEAFEPRGRVDRLLALLARGAVFPIASGSAAQPPEVWTTLMTGVEPARHGVVTADADRLPGIATPLRPRGGPLSLEAALRFLLPTRTVPASGLGRRVPTLWEILSMRSATVAVGWWTSWPAVPGPSGGYVVSDRVLPKLVAGREPDRDTAPASLFGRLRTDFDSDRAALRSDFEAAFGALAPGDSRVLAWESFLIDSYAWRLTDRLLDDATLRGGFVYLPGLEILRHRLATDGATNEVQRLLETQQVLESYVGWLDGILERAALERPAWNTIVLADPGREGRTGAEGFLLVIGPAASAGCLGPPVDRLAPAAVALSILGFPPSEEMPGRVPEACWSALPRTPGPIESYGERPRVPGRAVSDYDEEMVERLRSLGYLN